MTGEIITDRENFFSLENLYNAFLACRRHKRNTINAMRFESRLLENLYDLHKELVERTYHPSSSICFVQKRPKMREIFAADFRDRVVHHLLTGYLEPLFERLFIHDSYACRNGKGIHAGVTRLRSFLNRVTANGTSRAWYLQEDIKGFFMNIDRPILYWLVKKKVKRKDVLWLAETVIFHDCTENYRFKGDRRLLGRIPPHKTLFGTAPGKGLPIGNLSSQFFANVYLNELDQFVKRELKCRFYLRYCDDFLLLSPCRDELLRWHKAIECFVREQLDIELKSCLLRPVSSGIDFLGYITRRRYVLVRRRVVNHLKERLDEANRSLAIRRQGGIEGWRFPEGPTDRFRSVASSYWGHFSWADSFRLRNSLFKDHPVLRACFRQGKDCYLEPRWTGIDTHRSIMRQWQEAKDRFIFREDILLLFRVGRFYECYGEDAERAVVAAGLSPVTGLRGFRYGCGFYTGYLARFLAKFRAAGFHVVIVEEIRVITGVRKRRPVVFYKHAGA